MIEIHILANGEVVGDSLKTKKTTLSENAVVLRILEEIKQKLLDMDYKDKIRIEEGEKKDKQTFLDDEEEGGAT